MSAGATEFGFSDSDDEGNGQSGASPIGMLLGTDGEEELSSQSEAETLPAPPRADQLVNTRRRTGRQRQLHRNSATREISAAFAAIRVANEVEALRRRRDELISLRIARLLTSGRRDFLMTVVLEYYDTFSNGFQPPRLPDISQYMNARIDRERFAYGTTGFGMDVWVQQWHRYMRIFPLIAIRVHATTCVDLIDPLHVPSLTTMDDSMATCMIEARGTMTGVISRQAIDTLLPHLHHREDLVQKLLGKPLNCPMTLRFYFNNSDRIIRLDFDADFFQAFSNVADVGLFEVLYMMEQATVRDCSMIPEVVGEENRERVLSGGQEESS